MSAASWACAFLPGGAAAVGLEERAGGRLRARDTGQPVLCFNCHRRARKVAAGASPVHAQLGHSGGGEDGPRAGGRVAAIADMMASAPPAVQLPQFMTPEEYSVGLPAGSIAGGVRRALRTRRQGDGRHGSGDGVTFGGHVETSAAGAQTQTQLGHSSNGFAHAAGTQVNGMLAPSVLHAPHSCPVSYAALWEVARAEAVEEARREPFLASFLYSTVLAHGSLQACVASFLAEKLSCPVLPATQLFQSFTAAYAADASLVAACHADLQAVVDRDPACRNYIQCVLFFKGFQALQAHRLAHHLWTRDRKPLALGLQSRVSERMQVDIHPGAVIGPGLMLDHATGVVIGETAVVGTNCSFLHKVTLGGTGVTAGDRHPKIGDGVLIGAGVSVLGPVRVGNGVKIGAGSVLLQDVPDRCTAVGVPACVIARPSEAPDAAGSSGDAEPAILMDQMVSDDDSSHWAYII